MSTVDPRLVEIALEYVSGDDFERFFHAFYPELAGISFIPLGGIHDGGADAFQGDQILEGKTGRAGTFYQASVQQDHRAKIRHTVQRLRMSNREPNRLIYCTSRTISFIDREEEELSNELDVTVTIRDRKWIAVNINRSQVTVNAFNSFLKGAADFLSGFGAPTIVSASDTIQLKTMCVFLGQEVDRRRGNTDLLEAVTDSLILWALEGTDPDQGVLMNRDQILEKVEAAMPKSKQFIRGSIDSRLDLLSSKGNASGRELRFYRKTQEYCLPYETRLLVEKENIEDEALKLRVLDIYRTRAEKCQSHYTSILPDQVASIAQRTLELTFEKEGLELAEFLSGAATDERYGAITDQVDEAILEANLSGIVAVETKSAVVDVLRQAFYDSEEDERVYYGKLSRTYSLMLSLSNEPKVVEYFKGMSGDFTLFVGSDIIIRALSERYLPKEDQMTVNMLKILKSAGSTLMLTEPTVAEVQGHLALSDNEYRSLFLEIDHDVHRDIARHCNRILIRAYYYAKTDETAETRPRNWEGYIGQICSYRDLHISTKSREQVKDYLIEEFGLEFVAYNEIEKLTDHDEVLELVDRVKEFKSEEFLAKNDALHILAVYGKRDLLRERHHPNPYGYKTWWLTHEARVLRATKTLVRSKGGAGYIMRPEFIMNFISLSPSLEEVHKSYNKIFPTILGVRLSNRMRNHVFEDVMSRAKEAREISPARSKALLSAMATSLKGDGYRAYETASDKGKSFPV